MKYRLGLVDILYQFRVPDISAEQTEAVGRMSQQIHRPAVGSQCKFHVMSRQLKSFQLLRFVEAEESRLWSDANTRKKLVNVRLVLKWKLQFFQYSSARWRRWSYLAHQRLLAGFLVPPQEDQAGHDVRRHQIQIAEEIRQQPRDFRERILLHIRYQSN